MVIAGKEKGKTGKILTVIPEKNRAIIEKVNLVFLWVQDPHCDISGFMIY